MRGAGQMVPGRGLVRGERHLRWLPAERGGANSW